MQHLKPALDVLKTEPYITLIQFIEIILGDAPAVMVEPDKELVTAGILRQMDKARITVLQNVVDKFLDHPEDDQLVLRLQPLPVIMEPRTGIHAARTADLLEKIVDRRFQAKIFEGRGHQAVGDIPDQLDSIVDNLFGIVDALKLGSLVKVHEILVQIKPRRGEQRARIVMQIGGDPLALLLLQTDRGIQQQLLLILFHPLQSLLIADDLTLMENDENDQPYGQRQHPNGAEK